MKITISFLPHEKDKAAQARAALLQLLPGADRPKTVCNRPPRNHTYLVWKEYKDT